MHSCHESLLRVLSRDTELTVVKLSQRSVLFENICGYERDIQGGNHSKVSMPHQYRGIPGSCCVFLDDDLVCKGLGVHPKLIPLSDRKFEELNEQSDST